MDPFVEHPLSRYSGFNVRRAELIVFSGLLSIRLALAEWYLKINDKNERRMVSFPFKPRQALHVTNSS